MEISKLELLKFIKYFGKQGTSRINSTKYDLALLKKQTNGFHRNGIFRQIWKITTVYSFKFHEHTSCDKRRKQREKVEIPCKYLSFKRKNFNAGNNRLLRKCLFGKHFPAFKLHLSGIMSVHMWKQTSSSNWHIFVWMYTLCMKTKRRMREKKCLDEEWKSTKLSHLFYEHIRIC